MHAALEAILLAWDGGLFGDGGLARDDHAAKWMGLGNHDEGASKPSVVAFYEALHQARRLRLSDPTGARVARVLEAVKEQAEAREACEKPQPDREARYNADCRYERAKDATIARYDEWRSQR